MHFRLGFLYITGPQLVFPNASKQEFLQVTCLEEGLLGSGWYLPRGLARLSPEGCPSAPPLSPLPCFSSPAPAGVRLLPPLVNGYVKVALLCTLNMFLYLLSYKLSCCVDYPFGPTAVLLCDSRLQESRLYFEHYFLAVTNRTTTTRMLWLAVNSLTVSCVLSILHILVKPIYLFSLWLRPFEFYLRSRPHCSIKLLLSVPFRCFHANLYTLGFLINLCG